MKKHLFLFLIACLFIITASAQETQSFKFKSSGTKFKLGKEMSYTGEIKISPSVKGADNSETNIIQKNLVYEILANQEYTVSGAIKILDVIDNSLTSLDVSSLTNLERLDCYRNQLTSLDVSNLTNLSHLDFGNNQLTSIDLSNLTNLKGLFCPNNQLTGLGLSSLTNLKKLVCYNNQLTSLDVSSQTNLERLVCYRNQLTSLDVSNLINLSYLDFGNNQLTSIDVSNLTNLQELGCPNNQLTGLGLSTLTNLKKLVCYNNQLTSLDVSGLKNLNTLNCSSNQLIDIKNEDISLVSDFSGDKQIRLVGMKIDENGGYISENSFDITDGHNINLPDGISFANGYFKCTELPSEDVNFSTDLGWGDKKIKGILKFGIKQSFTFKSSGTKFKLGDDTAYTGELKISPSVKNADDSETNIIQNSVEYEIVANREYTVSGVISGLACNDNQLKSLDVSNLTNLKSLDCFINELKSLDVSNLTNLEKLDCASNQLKSLDVSNLTNLEELDCRANQLISLDVSGLINLNTLNCSSNRLIDIKNANTSLVSDFTSLNQTIFVSMKKDGNGGYISENSFEINDGHSINMSKGMSLEDGYFKCTELPSEDVTFSTDIGWGNKKIRGRLKFEEYVEPGSFKFESSGTKFKLIYIGLYTGELKITPSVKESDNFETSIIQNDVEYEILANQEYTVSGVIKSLVVEDNSLTSLDVSNLTNLHTLLCYNNHLTSLNLSGLTKLENLDCRFNQLIDIKNENTSPVSDFYGNNQIRLVSMKINEDGGYISENSYAITQGHTLDIPDGISLENGYFKCAELPSEDVNFSTDISWGYKKIEGKLKFEVPFFKFKSSGTEFKLGDATSYTGEIKISPSVLDPDDSETNVIQKNLVYEIVADQEYIVSGFITDLVVMANSLTSLDVSNLTNLKILDCSDNKLSGLDVSGLPNLNTLNCSSNRLIDIKNDNISLVSDFSGDKQMKVVSMKIDENGGYISEKNFDITDGHNINLPDGIALENGYFKCTELPSEDVTFNTDIAWGDKKIKGKLKFAEQFFKFKSSGTKFELGDDTAYTGELKISPSVKNADDSKTNIIQNGIEYEIVANQEYTVSAAITALDVAYNSLTSLDVSNLTKLEKLDCYNNQLTNLDVFNLINLENLRCSENQLTSLDVSNLTNLEALFCSENQLINLDVSNLKNLKGILCHSNQLTSLDVSNLTNLKLLSCSYNQLTSLDVSDLKELKGIDCSDNQLTSLDVSDLKELKGIDCSDNQLTSLNVSELTNLEFIGCSSNQLLDVNNANANSLSSLSGGSQNLWIPMKADASGEFISINTYNTIVEGHKIELPEGFSFEAGRFKCLQIPNEEILFSTDIGLEDQKIEGKLKFERVIESSISCVKKLKGKDLIANQFEFVLLNDSEKIVGTARNAENGGFTISILSPREAVTYNYILKEKNDGQQGYTYDTKEYSVELIVALNTENVLAASITIKDGETIVETPVFTNTYIDTGINEFNADSQIKLYPNPVNDILQIESLETIKEITLSDISGKILITQQVNDTHFSLPTAQFNAGIYIIRLQTAKGLEYRKIIKE